jgi:hypothetical protein
LTLKALEPEALELSIRISAEIEHERQTREAHWQKRLQRARYEVERAARQYHAVEPEHRLVARTLEHAWNERLEAERQLQEAYERVRQQEPRHLTATERATIRQLATHLPTLWAAPTTTPADRKAVLRLLIERVVVTVATPTEWVDVAVHWTGGPETHTRIRRPVGTLVALSTYRDLLAEIRRLRGAGHGARAIAAQLNAAGWVTPTQRNIFNERLVRAMVHRHDGGPKGRKQPPRHDPPVRWLADVATSCRCRA